MGSHGFLKHLFHVFVMIISLAVHVEWKIFRDSFEEETENGMAKFGLALSSWLKSMDNVHLKIHKLPIDRVFRWSMEVILQTMKVTAVNMRLKQTNGRSSEEVVKWGFRTLQNNLNLLTFLVEFDLLSSIDISILELKIVILEILINWHVCLKVDWCL